MDEAHCISEWDLLYSLLYLSILPPLQILQYNTFKSSTLTAAMGCARYLDPERLNNEGLVKIIDAAKVQLIAIDEAHCTSELGTCVRSDYLILCGECRLLPQR